MNYWIFKTEPGSYSIDDLQRDKVEHWDGIRNYQARNMLRDDVKKGDMVVFYHSSCKIPSAVGIATVVREGYPDYTAWDIHSEHPDKRSTPERPVWYMVDIRFKKKFQKEVPIKEMRLIPELRDIRLLQKGNRLSLFPIAKRHFDMLYTLGSK